jgi:hypothetical protein
MTLGDGSTLDLDGAKKVGEGYHRDVYISPLDVGRCVKVPKLPKDEIDNRIDFIYTSHLERRGVPFDFIPRCHGWIETSRGRGLVFDRITNPDGGSCESFQAYLMDRRMNLADAMPMLERLQKYLMDHAILMADVGLTNLIVQERAEGQVLFLIDGLGARRLDLQFLLNRSIPALGRRRTRRKWRTLLGDTRRFMASHGLPTGLGD